LKDLGVDNNNIKMDITEVGYEDVGYSSGSGQGPHGSCCDHGNEHSRSTKGM